MKPQMNIIGCGRAAGSLARLWQQSGSVSIGHICNSSAASSAQAVQLLGEGMAVDSIAAMGPAAYWMIGTNDHQIEQVASTLAEIQPEMDGNLVFHLAGRFGLDVLSPLHIGGAALAALHPVRSLTHNKLLLADFKDTACVAEGNDEALLLLQPLIEAIGGIWMPVNSVNRGLYHAALSVVSNVTKAVAWKSQKWLRDAGLPRDTAAVLTYQLLYSTTQDLLRFGAKGSITGPIVRGDTSTVEAHLAELRMSQPDDVVVYQVFIRTVLELAEERGDLDEETLKRFQFLLDG